MDAIGVLIGVIVLGIAALASFGPLFARRYPRDMDADDRAAEPD